jgi:hypothetical protein
LKDLGTAPRWVEGEEGKQKVEFDFSGVSGNGLASKDGLGVVQNYVWEGNYEGCEFLNANPKQFTCKSLSSSKVDSGQAVSICKVPSEGYPIKSLENAALVNLAAFIKTIRNYRISSEKKASTKIGILLFPEFRRVLHMTDGRKITLSDVDNARWSNREVEGGWKYTIELLPTSVHRASQKSTLKEFWLMMGVVSHEVGHHIFAGRVPELKMRESTLALEMGTAEPVYLSYFEKPINRDFSLETVISALDEGYADVVSHLTFSSSTSSYYGFVLDSSFEARRVAASQFENRKTQLMEEKALTDSVLRHFANHKRTFPARNSYVPDHQDEHAIGAIVANALDTLFGKKFQETRIDLKTEGKYRLFNAWLDAVQELFLHNKETYEMSPPVEGYSQRKGSAVNYNSGPILFLRDAMWEAVKIAFVDTDALTNEQCEVLETKFPVYVVNWRGKYKCR